MATPHIKSETQMMKLDLCNVAVSSGSACSSGKVRTSHVLKAIQIPDVYQSHVIRISIGTKKLTRRNRDFSSNLAKYI